MRIYLILVTYFLSHTAVCAENITIYWPKFFWPPFNTANHDGYFDLQHRYVTSRLSGFKHELLEKIPPNRLVYYVTTDSEQAYCYWGMEDSDFFQANGVYSQLVGYAPELQLVMTRDSRSKLQNKYGNPVPLVQLLRDGEYAPALETDRPLSEEIRTIVSETTTVEDLKRFTTQASPFQKYSLVMKNRFPVILENFIAFYWIKNNFPEAEPLVIEAFEEQKQFFSQHYVLCNQSEDSRTFIAALNKVLAETVHSSEFIELVKPFYNDDYYRAYQKKASSLSSVSQPN